MENKTHSFSGWIARDEETMLLCAYFGDEKPIRMIRPFTTKSVWTAPSSPMLVITDEGPFEDMTHEDEPMQVTLTITAHE